MICKLYRACADRNFVDLLTGAVDHGKYALPDGSYTFWF
jgi:hypothetical protein